MNITYEKDREDAICGGLRLKQTTVHDGISSSNDIVKRYKYADASQPGLSSGVLFREPRYAHRLNHNTALFSAYSIAPLSDFDGYHIGYERVVIDHNGLGETETVYHIEERQRTDYSFPVVPASYKVMDGVPVSEVSRNNAGKEVSRTTSTKYSGDGYTSYGGSSTTGYIYALQEVGIYESGKFKPVKKITPYRLRTNIYRPYKVTTTVDGLTNTTTYRYSSKNLLPKEIKTTNSDGTEYRQTIEYAQDFYDSRVREKIRDRHMINLPYRTYNFVNGERVDGNIVEYRFWKTNGTSPSYSASGREQFPRVRSHRRYERTWDANGNISGGMRTQITNHRYNTSGQVTEYQEEGWDRTYLTYNRNRLTSKRFRSHTQSYAYYGNSPFLKTATAIDGTTTTHTYDKLNRLKTSRDDCRDILTNYGYHFTTGGGDKNYLTTKTDFPTPSRNGSAVDILEQKTFLDGLGREIQNIEVRTGPSNNFEDILTARSYDRYGRVSRTYDPKAYSYNNGAYRSPQSSWGYTTTTYEASPLSRMTSTKHSAWHATRYAYGTNSSADAVKQNGTSTIYGAGTLSKRTVIDGNGNRLITFTDRMGRSVLSRRTNAADNASKRRDTYTLYDGKGRVSKVLPPGANVNSTNLIYTYRYREDDLVTEKRIPGRGPIKYRYTYRDQLAAVQDANLRSVSANRWFVHRYDSYGREIRSGLYTGNLSNTDALEPTEVHHRTTYGSSGIERGRVKTVQTRVLGSGDFLTTTNTYDDCGRLREQRGNHHLDLDNTELTTYSYDGADNLIASVYNHEYGGDARIISSRHDYDRGGRNVANYFGINTKNLTQLNALRYNARGELTRKSQGGTGLSGARRFLQYVDYSYLGNGMLRGINLNVSTGKLSGGQVGLPGFGQTSPAPAPGTPNASSSQNDKDLFQLELYRDTKAAGTSAAARRNGDIVSVATQVRGRRQMLWNVRYDEYDQLRSARFYERSSAKSTASLRSYYDERVRYDRRGNITGLERLGVYQSGGKYYYDTVDELDYDYYSGTNRLRKIDDEAGSRGYRERSGNYTYDANGNLTKDPSRQVTVTYNHLDLPVTITKTDGNRLEMTYDAGGTLLRRSHYLYSSLLERRDYVGGIEYVDGDLESISHGEGRVYYGNGSARYDYALTDHLGNTRLLYADINKNGVPDVPGEIIQEEHYYPFGMKMTGPWMRASLGAAAGAKTAYQYNGIEHVDAFDLDVNMAFYRTLDPVTGRWWQVDPKAESFAGLSPYNSMGNSPMNFADPDGAEPITIALGIAAALGAFNGRVFRLLAFTHA